MVHHTEGALYLEELGGTTESQSGFKKKLPVTTNTNMALKYKMVPCCVSTKCKKLVFIVINGIKEFESQ